MESKDRSAVVKQRYVNILTNGGFKAFFGDKNNKLEVIDILNALLPEHRQVADIDYLPTEHIDVINSFPDDYRIPFSMHVAGYKYNEIAEEMNLPLGTVKSRIFFARKKLQSMLKDYR